MKTFLKILLLILTKLLERLKLKPLILLSNGPIFSSFNCPWYCVIVENIPKFPQNERPSVSQLENRFYPAVYYFTVKKINSIQDYIFVYY